MGDADERPVGLTKDVGFQIGVRKTLPIQHEAAWQLVTSTEGVNRWLGSTRGLRFEEGETYELADGSSGEVRVCSLGSHVRVTWQPGGWPRASTIQVRVLSKGEKSVIAFHQEHLPSAEARETRRAHFKAALKELERLIASTT